MGSKDNQLTEEEYQNLLNEGKNIKEKLIISLLGEAGLRAGEVAHTKKNWIDFQRKQIRIPSKDGNWTPKTKKGARTIPFTHNPCLETLLSKYFTIHEEIGVSRQTIHTIIKQRATTASIPHNVYPHALRSTAAQRYANAGLSAQSIRNIMGWALLATAEAYIESSGINVERELEYARKKGTI